MERLLFRRRLKYAACSEDSAVCLISGFISTIFKYYACCDLDNRRDAQYVNLSSRGTRSFA